ncbi:MAG: hypothetical protein M1820_008579 [Bogoriella megaspora]|nr:MAG: hypothetical protein M1820_008579 [Bogoriella megaspora]
MKSFNIVFLCVAASALVSAHGAPPADNGEFGSHLPTSGESTGPGKYAIKRANFMNFLPGRSLAKYRYLRRSTTDELSPVPASDKFDVPEMTEAEPDSEASLMNPDSSELMSTSSLDRHDYTATSTFIA